MNLQINITEIVYININIYYKYISYKVKSESNQKIYNHLVNFNTITLIHNLIQI